MITEFEPERLLAGIGNRAETETPQGVVLLLPDLFGSFLFQFAAGAFVDLVARRTCRGTGRRRRACS